MDVCAQDIHETVTVGDDRIGHADMTEHLRDWWKCMHLGREYEACSGMSSFSLPIRIHKHMVLA